MERRPFDKEAVSAFPQAPGVYVFFGKQGKPLYVGKALNLRSRVRSYFTRAGDARLVTRLLEGNAIAMDFIVTGSEKEALILENSLIKKHAPRFNIRLRDDKTYFSLRLDLEEEWPMLRIVRKRKRDGALYFGPYTSAQACRRTIQYLNGIFPLRTCPDSVLHNRVRPCLSHEIGRCVAPCVDLVTRDAYLEIVQRVARFLKGQDTEVLAEVEAEMHRAADALEFERAAELRDRLEHMRKTIESPQVMRRGGIDRDVIGLYDAGDQVVLTALHVRDGQLTASATFNFRRVDEPDAILGSFLGQFYGTDRAPPAEILLPRECSDPDLHREILEDIRGASVALKVPERGEGVRLLQLAERNAQLAVERRAGAGESREVLDALQRLLRLRHFPHRIECYDVSHLGGEQVVGSGVTFIEARPEKRFYRHYKLREVRRNDDFAAMEEVLRRRIQRGLREDDLPDLIVIDGGKGQLGRVRRLLLDLEVDACDVVGMAKARRGDGQSTLRQHERIFLPDEEAPIPLDPSAAETHLLQRLRDEAHRFAISYSRRLRGKEKVGSVLEMIPGVGHRRSQVLLKHFGSVKGVKTADVESLAGLPGITPGLARTILEWLRENTRS